MIACYPFRLHRCFYRSSSYHLIPCNPLFRIGSDDLSIYRHTIIIKNRSVCKYLLKKSRFYRIYPLLIFGNLAKCSDFAENYRNDLEISSTGRLSEAVKQKHLTTKTAVSAADPVRLWLHTFPGSRGSRRLQKPIYIICCILIPFPNRDYMGHCTPLQPILCRQKNI